MSIQITTINSNGQITIPAKYRHLWNLKPNTKVKIKISNKKQITILDNPEYTLDDLPKIVGNLPSISTQKIDEELKNSFKPSKI